VSVSADAPTAWVWIDPVWTLSEGGQIIAQIDEDGAGWVTPPGMATSEIRALFTGGAEVGKKRVNRLLARWRS